MIILLLMGREKEDRKILVHVCCGPCATSSIKRLLDEGWSPVLFFSDSNIWPIEEFEKRYDTLLTVASFYNLEVIKDDYNHSDWREWVKGLENEPEHGKRCQSCFRYNLLRARCGPDCHSWCPRSCGKRNIAVCPGRRCR